MSADDLYQRLADIARKLEELAAATWCLERERDELRGELRRLNAVPAKQAAAA